MGKRDPRIDAYIEKSAPFAQPILAHLRDVVHAGCPDVEETVKWGMPYFMYRGMLCSMAAFKEHCAFGFWKGALIVGDEAKRDEAMGQLGRITSIADLPPKKVLTGYVREARRLNAEGVKVAKKKPAKRAEAAVPDDLAAALKLKKNAKARATFERFSPSQRRDYTEWIVEAKRDETRARRVATAVEWLADGKSRNWKYERG